MIDNATGPVSIERIRDLLAQAHAMCGELMLSDKAPDGMLQLTFYVNIARTGATEMAKGTYPWDALDK